MTAAKNMPKIYYEIYNNLKAKFEKTGYVGKQKYSRWEGPADQKAHMIAKSYINKRTNRDLVDDLDYYYQKLKELELKKSFEHPDYKHVHDKEKR